MISLDFLPFSIFPLEIFPQGALSSSVITTAWIGIFVVCFFNMRFGWVLSGLIVPGYLVPLLLIKPWSAGVTILEGIITYLIVWIFSEKLSGSGLWSSLFGRDRFFALIVCSVFVRILFDAYLLPGIGSYLNQTYALNFDYHSNLHSFGLIIVSLIANQFWKTGLLKGLGPFFVIMTISLLLVRYGLMELTNFTLSNLNYIYEDIASSILASPKAYIILLSAAFIASRMNLRYGWDFNGILIPSLLALQWYQPLKILTSFLEAFIILLIAHFLLKMPLFANINMEGARKTLLFFNIGFIYKLLLGHYLLWQFPEVKVTDAYGFGYLLSTLIAVKMYDKEIAIRFTLGTLQTSLIAVFIASLAGFLLALSYPLLNFKTNSEPQIQGQYIDTMSNNMDNNSLTEQIRNDKITLYQSRSFRQLPTPSALELKKFSQSLKAIQEYLQNKDDEKLQQAIKGLDEIGFGVQLLEQRYLYINEKNQLRGWGIYIIDIKTDNKLLFYNNNVWLDWS
jgi:gamma-polyglutamate biosynthesis protein CapC